MKYKNRHLCAKNRLKKLIEKKMKCELCGKKAKYIHHKDFSNSNHSLRNLMVLCQSCHFLLHIKCGSRIYVSKYREIYGLSLKEITSKYKIGSSTVQKLHEAKKLRFVIDNPDIPRKHHQSSKFNRLYNMTCQEMADRFGGTSQRFSLMEKEGRLKNFLKNKLHFAKT